MLFWKDDAYEELHETGDGRKYIVVAFWGVETTREYYGSRRRALVAANDHAANGADVHVAVVIGERLASEHG